MGKFDGVLLVSDFDDTLYTADHRIPPRNLEALSYFVSQGGRFTVATGRAYRTFAPYVHLTPINAPVVLSNGSALYDFAQDTMLEQTFLPDCTPEIFSRWLERFPSLGMELYHGEDIYVWNPNLITQAHMKKVGTSYTLCPLEQMPLPWTKSMVHQDHATLLAAQDWILKHYGDFYEAIFSNQYYLEITQKGSTKGGMTLNLANRLGIDRSHIYCVGDNQNDIPMLELSAIPFAPSNCAHEVRQWGARILCSCDEGIMGDIMDILDKRYE